MAKIVFVIDPGFVDHYALNGASICKRPYEPSETLIVSVTSDWHLNGIFLQATIKAENRKAIDGLQVQVEVCTEYDL